LENVAENATNSDRLVVEFASLEETELTERLMRTLTGIGHELAQFLGRRRG